MVLKTLGNPGILNKLLIEYFESNNRDIEKISVLMERTERSIRLKLIELDLIEKD